jgi:uncharacterized OB-fold protein
MPRHLGDQWILPELDPMNREWFTAGALRVQNCNACGADQHPPEEVCGGCQSTDLGFRDCGATGRVESSVVVHHAVHPLLKDRVPYTVAVVSLDGAPGCHAVGNIVDTDEGPVEIGQAVTVVFETVEDEPAGETLHIPLWKRA